MATYQTRIRDYGGMEQVDGDAALLAYAELYGRMERKLFAEVGCGEECDIAEERVPESVRDTCQDVQPRCGFRWRGRSRRCGSSRKLRGGQPWAGGLLGPQQQIAGAAEYGRWDQVHQKRRRLATLQSRLAALEADIAQGRVRLCFGSKRLWHKQRHLEANGYANHQEWLTDWQDARSGEFFVLGSRDETSGCQLLCCQRC